MLFHKAFFLIAIPVIMFGFFTNQCCAEDASCTSTCHNALRNDTHLAPEKKESCTNCHKAKSLPHPQKNSPTFTISNEPCLTCHPQVVDYALLHAPVAAGECSACHNPHSKAKSKYIKETGTLICSSCHPPVFAEGDTVFHGEINQGTNKCQACHTQHGSQYPRLLRGNYSTDYFNDYQSSAYELCFRCHKIDLLLHPKTSYNTNFRDGKNNLHYVHVNRALKGRACKFCHEVHSGTLPKLMANTVHFGEWSMPINFVQTQNGGQCSPGCHRPAAYQRTVRK